MAKDYVVTWSEAREILGEENFHDLVDLQDMHPDLRLMPEEWEQFRLIPYSPKFLKEHKDQVVLFPAIDHDINGNLINFLWFNENFPGILQGPRIESAIQLMKRCSVNNLDILYNAPEKRWHLIFKGNECNESADKYPFPKEEGLVTYIFAAMLNYRKTGKLLWQDLGNILLHDADLDAKNNNLGPFSVTLRCRAYKKLALDVSCPPDKPYYCSVTLPDSDKSTIVAPFPRIRKGDVLIVFHVGLAETKHTIRIFSLLPNKI